MTMKAIIQDRYGPPEVLSLATIATPAPGPGEVLVRVHAAGVDPSVWHLMTGTPYLTRAMGFGLRRPKVRVRGTSVAGRIEAVGPGVTWLQPGDAVFGYCDGAFAEYVCATEDAFVPKPERLTFEEAAAVPDSACTALHALRDSAKLEAGQRVLVIGAAGGVGSFAVQIARALGARVTGVCSTSKVDLVRSLGAEEVIDYTREDFADGRTRYDVIIDTAGNRSLSHLRRALTPQGTLVIVGGEGGGRWLGGMTRNLQALLISPFVGHKLQSLFSMTRPREDLQFLADLIDAGKMKPVLDRTFPLTDTADAIRHWQNGHARGKVVVTV